MTIRSSASLQRRANRERLDKEQDSQNNDSCRKGEQNNGFPARVLPTHYDARTGLELDRAPNADSGETLLVVHPALLFRSLPCGRLKFRGQTGKCVLHEQIVILFPSCKVLSKEQRSRLKD
jgi:hypothetical protein